MNVEQNPHLDFPRIAGIQSVLHPLLTPRTSREFIGYIGRLVEDWDQLFSLRRERNNILLPVQDNRDFASWLLDDIAKRRKRVVDFATSPEHAHHKGRLAFVRLGIDNHPVIKALAEEKQTAEDYAEFAQEELS